MNHMEQEKKRYEETEIPAELNDRVQAGIRQGKANYRKASALRRWKRSGVAVAACLAMTVGVLNVSPTAAAAAADLPVLGGLFQVLTLRDYTEALEDYTVDVEQPAVTGTALADKVTAEIQTRVDAKLAEGEQIVSEFREAFFATGGTEEQWAERENEVSVTYEIKSQTDTTVSFVVDSYVSVASAYQEQVYYNLDLANDKVITLADVLGEDWVTVCNDSIKAQMAAAEDPSVYFDESFGGFTTVDEMTQFYLNEAGDPVVVFPRATVAIGAMGIVEFEIGA